MSAEDKIFIYLRIRDDKKTLMKSRIREFAAIGKLLADFMREVITKYGMQILKLGNLEYVDANTDIVLASFKRDAIRQQIIVTGIIPKNYQSRMLSSHEAHIKFSIQEFAEMISPDLDNVQKAIILQKLQNPHQDILSLIADNINENGEFYVVLDVKTA